MSNWYPRFVKEELSCNHKGDVLIDGAGYPLRRGFSNYYSMVYGIAWFGVAFPCWQGRTTNHLTGRRL